MRIGELERRTGVARRLLRYYEEQGLLHPEREPGGYRSYADCHVEQVARIRRFLDAGLGTDAIRAMLPWAFEGADGPVPCRRCFALLNENLAGLEARIAVLERQRELLAELGAAARPDGGHGEGVGP